MNGKGPIRRSLNDGTSEQLASRQTSKHSGPRYASNGRASKTIPQ